MDEIRWLTIEHHQIDPPPEVCLKVTGQGELEPRQTRLHWPAVEDRHIHVAVRPVFAARHAAEQVDGSGVVVSCRENMGDFLCDSVSIHWASVPQIFCFGCGSPSRAIPLENRIHRCGCQGALC